MSLVISDSRQVKNINDLTVILTDRFKKVNVGDIIRVVWGGSVNRTVYYMLVRINGGDKHLVNLETGDNKIKFHSGSDLHSWFVDTNGNLLIKELEIASNPQVILSEYHND